MINTQNEPEAMDFMLVAISCVSKWKFIPAQPSDNPHEITADFKRALLWISWKD